MKIALIQLNPIVGDIEGNFSKILKGIEAGRELTVDIIAFPEMVMTGYPPQDLLYEQSFLRLNKTTTLSLANQHRD